MSSPTKFQTDGPDPNVTERMFGETRGVLRIERDDLAVYELHIRPDGDDGEEAYITMEPDHLLTDEGALHFRRQYLDAFDDTLRELTGDAWARYAEACAKSAERRVSES